MARAAAAPVGVSAVIDDKKRGKCLPLIHTCCGIKSAGGKSMWRENEEEEATRASSAAGREKARPEAHTRCCNIFLA